MNEMNVAFKMLKAQAGTLSRTISLPSYQHSHMQIRRAKQSYHL